MNSFLTSALVAFMAVVVIPFLRFLWRAYKVRRAGLNEQMKMTAERAVRSAAEEGIQLDYSTDSIRQVESILKNLHERYLAAPDSVNAPHQAARYGAYIGEAIRRNDPNYKSDPSCGWKRDHEVAGQGSYPLRWQHRDIFPIGWCYKRIVDGEDDNVWIKYRLLADQISGLQATIKLS